MLVKARAPRPCAPHTPSGPGCGSVPRPGGLSACAPGAASVDGANSRSRVRGRGAGARGRPPAEGPAFHPRLEVSLKKTGLDGKPLPPAAFPDPPSLPSPSHGASDYFFSPRIVFPAWSHS